MSCWVKSESETNEFITIKVFNAFGDSSSLVSVNNFPSGTSWEYCTTSMPGTIGFQTEANDVMTLRFNHYCDDGARAYQGRIRIRYNRK